MLGAPRLRVLIASVVVAASLSAPVAHADMTIAWERTMLPVTADGGSYKLETLIVHPNDDARHPLAVISHGSPRDAADRPGMSPGSYGQVMQWFVRRGWTVAAMMRRGYGHSDGAWAEEYGSCANPDYYDAGKRGAADIAASIVSLAQNPHVDASHALAVGVSAGGFATVALTAQPPATLTAAIAFAPGRGSHSSDDVCAGDRLVDAMKRYGATSRVPLLWISAANDHYFGPRLVNEMVGAFNGAGGKATLVAAPAFGEDGHYLFTAKGGDEIWGPEVDRFLVAHRIALVPTPADLAVPAVPDPRGNAAKDHEEWARYLLAPPHKAFAASADGHHFGFVTGRYDLDQAKSEALGYCKGDCKIVSLDGAVVK
jgi:dienelactone hydrolase